MTYPHGATGKTTIQLVDPQGEKFVVSMSISSAEMDQIRWRKRSLKM